ncbi:hypothetical protein FPOA_08793 [Fusarium poae]|uniref:Uncharacterized protein n=1 Tax=Fusarium poae TaxID=36050 RepID=A0A1B8AQ09_FUSPO|nr:hypothetical protein FPOA_08793 [Fusarium poae]
MASSMIPENQRLVFTSSSPEDTVSDRGKEYPTLREISPSWIFRVGAAAALLLVPVAYLVLLGIVAYLSGKKQSSFGDDTLEVLKLASTLWPISFAAVIGPFLKTLALYAAERGSTLGSLEFLLTSQTTIAAVKNIFAFRHIQIWTIGIVAIWSLSPLGGQAAVRSLDLQSPRHFEKMKAAHYFSQAPLRTICQSSRSSGSTFPCESVFGSASNALSNDLPGFRRVVNTAFSRTDVRLSHPNGSSDGYDAVIEQLGGVSKVARLGKQDIWGNVRIPFMELLPEYDDQNPESWTKVPSDKYVPYSSFVGVPIRGGSRHEAVGNTSMVLHTRYQTLSCGDTFNGTSWFKLNGSDSPLYFHRPNFTDTEPLQHQTYDYKLDTKPSLWLDLVRSNATESHFYNTEVNATTESPLKLIVGGQCGGQFSDASELTHMIRVCNLITSYVDVDVSCKRLSSIDDLDCQADRIRQTSDPGYSTYLSDLSHRPAAKRLVYEMPFTTATYYPMIPSLLERYIHDPLLTFEKYDPDARETRPGCFTELSQALFEARFATALNTFLMAAYNDTVLGGIDAVGYNMEKFVNSTFKERNLNNHSWQNTTATWAGFTDNIYVMNVAWFCISVISTAILLGCAIINVIIRQLVWAPDFLDSVDGLTRDSPFVRIPGESCATGSGVSSRDRLQATSSVRVQIRDVEPDADVGKIVLTTDTTDKRLDWNRAYV